MRPCMAVLPCTAGLSHRHVHGNPATRIASVSQCMTQYFVTCHPGAEHVLSRELVKILEEPYASSVSVGKSGVHFEGDMKCAFDVNLWARSAIRVLHLISRTELDSSLDAGTTLYTAFRNALDWPAWLDTEQKSFTIDSRIWGNSNFSNSQLLNTRGMNAICDAVRSAEGFRPMPPQKGRIPDLPLFATCFNDTLSIYLDYSGPSLHKRGFASSKKHKASLNECVAATSLYLSGFVDRLNTNTGGEPLILADPMCGSGTILTEAAMMAGNIAPGLYRRFWPFFTWPIFDKELWDDRFHHARSMRAKEKPNVQLWGNDIHQGALDLAAENLKAAGVSSLARLRHGDVASWKIGDRKPDLFVTNPPWGQRLMSDDEDLEETWKKLGTFLKEHGEGSEAFIISGSKHATQFLRMRADKRFPLTVGGADCRLLKYSIHERDTYI